MNGDGASRGVLVLLLVMFLSVGCGGLGLGSTGPEPGARYAGSIAMESAGSARIAFEVTDDGQAIESVSLAFTDLVCEGFSAGSSSSMMTTYIPISDGRFEYISSDMELSGQFTSPTAAQGTVHFVFYGAAECGTWEWSATAQ